MFRKTANFGHDPNPYCDAKSRNNYARTSPTITISGRSRVVHARHSRKKRLADALYLRAHCSTNWPPGAKAYFDSGDLYW